MTKSRGETDTMRVLMAVVATMDDWSERKLTPAEQVEALAGLSAVLNANYSEVDDAR